ncbi:QcrA and Rieske domain-containing protein [Deinococcus aquiradiocola]|uniref:QcrA and Rieske domain-containing protein n=1 Tax=Deinococcus aquiradiocola TaxID=393059 RepID=UPI00166BA2AE|nr:Rieske 2Fe-2S domain-containing protein [Deinococcus aquiradiocola]
MKRRQARPLRDSELTRRQTLALVTLAGGTLAAAAAGYPVARAVLDPAFRHAGPGRWQTVGTVQDFPLGQTALVTFTRPHAEAGSGAVRKDTAWLTRQPDGWLALHNTCMHLGCPVQHQARSGLYFCPCHGGVYGADGRNLAGPPRIPLQRLQVRLNGQDVQVQPWDQPLPTLRGGA